MAKARTEAILIDVWKQKINPTACQCAASDKRAPGSWVMFRKSSTPFARDDGILWMTGWWFKYFLFSSLPGEMIQFD